LGGLAAGESSLSAAIALEEAASAADDHRHDGAAGGWGFTRGQQQAGLVAGTVLLGAAIGAVFGVAFAWSRGRLNGDAWARSLKLGAVAVAAIVVLPALKYPANPPGIGDPATVGARTALYLGVGILGLLLAAAAWTGARQLAGTRLSRPARQAIVGTVTLLGAAAMLSSLPALPVVDEVGMPGELLWSFRLGAMATQVTLYGGTAAALGLLSARAERETSPTLQG
ncbi:MAG TPA: CbtA family protein, partial [Egibacteraceae bacterium]|nr:CbtA family protein [Egibacteraceae bacterium]